MRYVSWMLVVLPLTAPGPALAQCDGQIVSAIAIVPRAPSFIQFPRLLRPLARAVGLHHTTTKADVIRRFLLLSVGQPCTERLRTESERILRFQPFLADARVRAFPDEVGGVRIEVETIDEIPTVFTLRVRDGHPVALRLGNSNVAGRGVFLAIRGERGLAYRDGMGVQFVAYQAFGRPYTLEFVADRTPLGSTVSLALGHTFITDLQRTGFGSLDTFTFPKDVPVRIWDVGPAASANVAVTEVRPASLMVPAESSDRSSATLEQTSAFLSKRAADCFAPHSEYPADVYAFLAFTP